MFTNFEAIHTIGIMGKVVGRRVRFERCEARRCVLMALLAGLQQVRWRCAGSWIAGRPDRVAAVAIEARSRIGIAQGRDFTVVGLRIALPSPHVTVAAVVVEDKPLPIARGERCREVLVRQVGYCRMTIDAPQCLAVHALGKLIRRHVERSYVPVGARRCEALHAMTAETRPIVEVSSVFGACLRTNEDRHQRGRVQHKFAGTHGLFSPSNYRDYCLKQQLGRSIIYDRSPRSTPAFARHRGRLERANN